MYILADGLASYIATPLGAMLFIIDDKRIIFPEERFQLL